MKKNGLLLLCLTCLFSLYGKEIEVCSSCEVKTIKQAISMAEDGDEIIIKSGVYKEHDILIEKSIRSGALTGPLLMERIKRPFSRLGQMILP